MWDVQWVIFASGYIPKEEWEELAQTFYAYLYADSKRDVMRAYQSTLAMNISENATMYLQLFQKNKDNEIVPAQLQLAEMSTKKLSKKHKEEKSLELDNRMMSVHAKLPELNDSDWSKQSRKELQEALTDGKITEDDCNREIANLDEPIYGSGKTTDTKCVAQIGNYMVIDSELNGDCLYAAVIQFNDTIIKWGELFGEELPERAKELRERTYRHLQDRYENRQHLKQGTLLRKLLNDVEEDFDSYMSYVAGETSPPAGALEICALADLVLSDIEIHRSTVMKATLTKYLDTETGAMRKSSSYFITTITASYKNWIDTPILSRQWGFLTSSLT